MNTEQCKIDFTSIPWESPIDGARSKIYRYANKQVRLVEITNRFIETEWCTRGHIGYILDGQLEINFNGNIVIFNKGDGFFIPAGEKDKHIGRILTDVVKIIFVEDIS